MPGETPQRIEPPRRHPDGSLVAPAGDLRALTDEVQSAQTTFAGTVTAGPAGDSSPLRAEQYAVTVSGITCRVVRRTVTDGRPAELPAYWEVTVGAGYGHETTVTEHRTGRSEVKYVGTGARFGFNPDDLDSEQVALERAGSYCEQVARALSGLWQEQERIHGEVVERVSRARVQCGALPE